MSQTALATAIVSALSADQSSGTLYADVGGRIRWIVGESELDLPMLAFQFLGDVPEDFFDAAGDLQDVSVQFDVYTDRNSGPDANDAIREKAHALLHRVTLTATGFGEVQSWIDDKGASPTVEQDAFRTTMSGTLFAQ